MPESEFLASYSRWRLHWIYLQLSCRVLWSTPGPHSRRIEVSCYYPLPIYTRTAPPPSHWTLWRHISGPKCCCCRRQHGAPCWLCWRQRLGRRGKGWKDRPVRTWQRVERGGGLYVVWCQAKARDGLKLCPETLVLHRTYGRTWLFFLLYSFMYGYCNRNSGKFPEIETE
jgi:hypothetical protein